MTGDQLGIVIVATVVATGLLVAIPSILGPIGLLLLGVPLVVVFPGYVVVRLLFPADAIADEDTRTAVVPFDVGRDEPILTASLSVAFSVILVSIVARLLVATVGFSRSAIVLTIGAFVVIGALVATLRDSNTLRPTTSSPDVRGRDPIVAARSYFARDTMVGTASSVLVVAALVFFLSSIAFAFTAAPAEESYTEFYLLTENESGDLVATEYPSNLSRDDPTQLIAGIENHEDREITYTTVVEIQRVENGTLLERRELDRFETRLESNQTARVAHELTSPLVGDDLRLQYYLYDGEVPAAPSAETAANTLRLPVSVATD